MISSSVVTITILQYNITLYEDNEHTRLIKRKEFERPETVPSYLVLCGLMPLKEYFYKLEVVKEYRLGNLSQIYSVTSIGRFTVGMNETGVIETAPEWENENCSGYTAVVMWDFLLSQLLPNDDCHMVWYYSINGSVYQQIPDEYVTQLTNENDEQIEHVELTLSALNDDVVFNAKGITYNADNTVNNDYAPVIYEYTWANPQND